MSPVPSKLSGKVSGSGTARSTVDAVRSMGEMFDKFRAHLEASGSAMQIPRSPHDVTIGVGHLLTLARRSVFEAFADFLCGVYKKRNREGKEEELAGSSVIYYLRCSLREAQKRFEALRGKMSGPQVNACWAFFSALNTRPRW